ncbi:MAG TPA: PaaI family thioesterase, partial [Actinomycetota bacterium]|nr:PaaI family thioesterase [Actinomycetota bacterium]
STFPVGELFGFRGILEEEGKSSFSMPASQWFCAAGGTIYGGALAVLADAVMGGAVANTLPPKSSYATLDLKVHFLRPPQPDGRDLVATATVVHRGRRMAVATGDIVDADGKKIAMATSSHMIFEGRSWVREQATEALDEQAHDDGDD